MDQSTFVAVVLLLVSPFIGSILAVVVDRLQGAEDALLARSGCQTCGERIGRWHLVPVVSYLLLRGRCAACKAAISPALFYVEILTTGAAVLVVFHGGTAIDLLLNALFLWLLIALATCDMRWFRLPDALTALLALTAFGLGLIPGGIGFWSALAGAAIGAGFFMLLRLGFGYLRGFEMLGLGDIKLMVGLGAFAGIYDLPLLVLIAALIGLGVAGPQFLMDRSRMRGTRPPPFGAVLCAAGSVLWLMA